MKKVYLIILLIAVVSVIPIVILIGMYTKRLDSKSYSFTRNRIYPLKDISSLNLKYTGYYIAGAADGKLYLGNKSAPAHILIMDSLARDTQSVVLAISPKDFKSKGIYHLRIDLDHFYLTNGLGRSVLKGKTGVWRASPFHINRPYFQQSIALDSKSIVYKYVSSKTNANAFRKETLSGKRVENDDILEKQVDGLFCTEGILEYDKNLNLLYYVYLYRNRVITMDTNLRLIREIKTIDPIDTATFEVSTIKSSNTSVFTSPGTVVNAGASSFGKVLFIRSNIMGKHEDDLKFKHSIVIDAYNLLSGKYLYSFYLPRQKETPINQFKIIGSSVYTITDHYLIRYSIDLPSI